MTTTCPCGIARQDCEYHREQPKPAPLTFKIASITLGGITYRAPTDGDVGVTKTLDEQLRAQGDKMLAFLRQAKRDGRLR